MDPVGVDGAGAAFAKRPGQLFAGMLLYDRPEHSAGVPPQGSEVGFERAVGIIGSEAVRHLLRRQLLQFRTILVHMKIGHDASSSSPPPPPITTPVKESLAAGSGGEAAHEPSGRLLQGRPLPVAASSGTRRVGKEGV